MTPLNVQPPEFRDYHADGSLELVGLPWLTIQGEGPFAGRPAVFVRLAGCNLTCPACFHGKTRIRMADLTQKPIREVRAGDKVLSYDEQTGEFVKRKVTKTMQRQVTKIYRVTVTGSETRARTYVTGEHPFYVRSKGWVEAKDLQIGDRILHDGAERKRLFCLRASRRMSLNNPMKDPKVAIKGYLARHDRGKMTEPEKFVAHIGRRFRLQYVGDGSLVVGDKAPDFVIEGTKKLVEVWDRTQTEYYKRDEKWREERQRVLESEGYEVLFLPVFPYPMHGRVGTRRPERAEERRKEVRRVRTLLSAYAANGQTVIGVELIRRGTRPWRGLSGGDQGKLTVYNLEVEGTHTYIANGKVAHNCDTDYTSNRRRFDWREVWNHIVLCRGENRKTELVVFTGGEPFRQNMVPLVPELMHNDWEVQIETNGTIFPEFDDPFPFAAYNLTLVCSPKTPTINPKFHRHVKHLKYILDADHVADDGLPLTTLGNDCPVARPWPGFSGTVWVQPMDPHSPVDQDGGFGCTEEYQRNVCAAVQSCLKFGYRLSWQLHKELGVP